LSLIVVHKPVTIVYTTNELALNERPKDCFNLAHPRFKGKLAIEQKQVTWYAGMLKRHGAEKGKQYMKVLANLDPAFRGINA
jgi:ABC-type Fe3+ transport system substrate-binding protein